MKANIFKYIFFAIVILLIGLAIYLLYIDGRKEDNIIENAQLEINMDRNLNIGISGFDTINPILSNNRDIQYISKLIYDSLLNISSDFKIENSLAQEFSKINENTYIIKLKDNIYFHDGEKLTAKDVIFTIENLKKDDINSIYKENVKNIKELKRIDDYTVKIILDEEVNFFEYMMCIPILASHNYDGDILHPKNNIPVGTGKFKITKIEKDNILLEKTNSDSESKFTKINILLKNSVKDLYNAFERNEIDLMITDNVKYEEYLGTMGYNLKQFTNRELDYLVFNTKDAILAQKEIRQAINYAIDRNKINYAIYNNKYKVCNFPLDYGNYLYNLNNAIGYDINKTRNLLEQNGWSYKNNRWTKGYKSLELKLLVNSENEQRLLVAENIKEQLKEIGININITKVNNNQFNRYLKNKNYDIILTGNVVPNYPSLETYLGENNLSNYSNEKITNLLNDIKNITDEELLIEKYKQIEEIYTEEIPFICLYFNNLFILSNKSIKGNFDGNWYNIYYNIDNWYKVK